MVVITFKYGSQYGTHVVGVMYIMKFLRALYFGEFNSKIHIAKIGIAKINGLGCII